MNSREYVAKVLLFGEYTVLLGGSALAIPYRRYRGYWTTSCPQTPPLLPDFYAYLKEVNPLLHTPLHLESVKSLLNDQVFCSDIPMGTGLGSSAALSASLYDLFATGADTLPRQRDDLSLIEGFFHGKSSGFDALVSYQNATIYRKGQELRVADNTDFRHSAYLWQSGGPRSTAPLVSSFLKNCKNSDYRQEMTSLAEIADAACTAFLHGREFLTLVRQIGRIQFDNMKPLIPEEDLPYWQEILSLDRAAIKLCGAGGGGCTLLFSEEVDLAVLYPEISLEQIW